jgi:hypothetical protein
MRLRAILAVSTLLTFGASTADDLSPIGSFHNVRQSRGEESHCYGYSLELWRHNGRVIGLLDHHDGLCGDPPCEALRDVSYDPRAGRLTFTALDEKFAGTLRRDDVIGTIGASRVRLARDRHDPMDAKWDTSFAEWCAFWRGVHRCRGVDEMCRSAGQ